MKYFHRAHLPTEAVLARATEFLGQRLTPAEESPRRRRRSSIVGASFPAKNLGAAATTASGETDVRWKYFMRVVSSSHVSRLTSHDSDEYS